MPELSEELDEEVVVKKHAHHCPVHKTWYHYREDCPYPAIQICSNCEDALERQATELFGHIK